MITDGNERASSVDSSRSQDGATTKRNDQNLFFPFKMQTALDLWSASKGFHVGEVSSSELQKIIIICLNKDFTSTLTFPERQESVRFCQICLFSSFLQEHNKSQWITS